MVKNSLGNFCVFLGLLSLIHAAYSAAQHRAYLRLIEQTFESLPCDIVAQTILSLFLTIFGVTVISGDFKEIRAVTELENKTYEVIGNRPSFYSFSHRGRVLSSVYTQGSL
ncbi:ER membrane protein complex subunit 5-like [Argiope bruennichi]|uniref:Membrane magnesium transporter n=1 Tax=Argiope bruennichi TaxID=94029 RepID=A0A8T0F324_ARGBR|nr:ER membrane protein complex subunit 5-like [Argiope bruennichi]KAF8785574.1 Membrane magnesium transporter 1 like protein [Argiope bruennichi]